MCELLKCHRFQSSFNPVLLHPLIQDDTAAMGRRAAWFSILLVRLVRILGRSAAAHRCLTIMPGLPKPVFLTVDGLNSVYKQSHLGREDGFQNIMELFLADKRPMLAAVPFFHAMGIVVGLRSIMCRSTIVVLAPEQVWNASLVVDAITATSPATGLFPPSILEDISATEAGVQAIGTLETVFFGGAPLANASGEKLCQVTKLQTIIGSTEALLVPSLTTTSPEDWDYFHWSHAAGAAMEPTDNDLCELVLKPRNINYQAVFHTFPQHQEWRTKDLFGKHPTKPSLWRYSGRRDDTIVLSNGEKINPVLTEKSIESHPSVKGALVVGQGRFQTGLLIEPERDAIDPATLVERIWPTVRQANDEAPAHARVYQSQIAVTGRGRRFERTPKGSIMRLQTVAKFQNEIEALYDDDLSVKKGGLVSDGVESLESSILDVFSRSLASFPEEKMKNVDITSLKIDSLDVLVLAAELRKTLQRADITAATIYQNPTIKKLSLALSPNASKLSPTLAPFISREEELGTMVMKHTAYISRQRRVEAAPERPLKHTVLLTGSTGSLGSHLLETLLKHPDVDRVYCLNRSDDAKTRQKHASEKYHSPGADLDKAEFLRADFSLPRFGLANAVYIELVSSVTVLIHSAWSVNFNLSLSSYEAMHIAGIHHIVDFASSSDYRARVIFISSIASVGYWDKVVQDGSAVPESTTTLFDRSIALPQGYGESKHVAAEILAIASHRLGIQTTIVRASQLAGPSAQAGGAAWNQHEWLPALIHASKVMGKLPRTLGTMERVDWVPMDVAAASVVDFAMDPTSACTDVYHLANPHTTTWSVLRPVVEDYLAASCVPCEIVDYNDWAEEVGNIPLTDENAKRVPALKLLDFYKGLRPGTGTALPVLETKKAEAVSRTLREGRAVDRNDFRKWLGQWDF
jgi:thioester reductase-like protein